MVKLSPMLDMASALRDLKYIRELHVIAVNNECKELTAVLYRMNSVNESSEKEVVISCEQAVHNSLSEPFTYTLSEEKMLSVSWQTGWKPIFMNRVRLY